MNPRRLIPVCRISSLLVFVLLMASGCSNGSLAPTTPSGPTPAVQLDAEFGPLPLSGTLRIVPGPTTMGWRYRIDAIAPDSQDREGEVDGVIAVPYRFDTAGVHVIHVELFGPGDPVAVEKMVIVTDPDSDFEILAERPVAEIWPGAGEIYPEGIVIDPQGRWLYAANYSTGELVRIDPTTLEVVDRLRLYPSVEGLTITPSGDRLFAIHKYSGVSVVDLSSFTGVRKEISQGHFVEALDESRALVSSARLQIANLDLDSIEHESANLPYGSPHFSIFPGKGQVAVALNGPPTLVILAIPTFGAIRTIPLADISWARQVAADPDGDRIYVLGVDEESSRILTVDPASETVTSDLSVHPSTDCWCAANPVVTFASGRYIAFEKDGAVVVVDTQLGIPRFLFQPGDPMFGGPSGVAAAYDSDVLYVLGGNTDTQRLYKLRLRAQ